METVVKQTENITPKKQPDPLRFDIYNQLYNAQYVDVFAEEHEKHTGVISDKNTEYSADDVVSLMRFQTQTQDAILFGSVKIASKKDSEKIIPLCYWFNVNQFQSGIIDIPVSFSLDEPKLEFEVIPKTNSIITLFRGIGGLGRVKRAIPVFIGQNSPVEEQQENKSAYPKDMICLVIENSGYDFVKDVDIFNIPKDNSSIKVKSPLCPYDDLLKSVSEKSVVFDNLKVISTSSKQLPMPLYLKNKIDASIRDLDIMANFSANQFQSNIIHCSCNNGHGIFPADKDHTYTFDMHPHSKVMLFFYND